MPPVLFDRDLLALRRARAARAPADFLHEAVAREVSERLKEVNRSFRAPALVGPRPGPWRAALAQAGLPPPVCVPDDERLALEAGAHDLALHGLALHAANDPVGQLVQMRRALRPDGLMIAPLFAGETLAELRAVLAEAEIAATGRISPRVAPMAALRDLGALLQRAGLAMPVADAVRLAVAYASLFTLARDLRAMGETNVLAARLRRPTRRAIFERAARLYAERFPAPSGRIRASFEVVFLTGWAPAEGQQKPLRPGSARARLADALGAVEHPAGGRAGLAPRSDR
ncbi:methyltransferase domain-containing protein [soil metagenome]